MYSFVSGKPGTLFVDAVEDTEALLLSREDQLQLFNNIPKFERYFRILTEKSLVSSRQRMMDNLSLTAQERYETFCNYYPTLINALPQKMIASYIGVTPEFLSKMKDDLNDSNWSVIKKDAFEFLKTTNQKYDLIFADPPFDLKGVNQVPELVFSRSLLNENGLLIVEHGRENKFENITQFTEMRNYGGVQFSFFEV